MAFRIRFWNIGAEGQYVWGAIDTAWIMLYQWQFLPVQMLLPLCFLVGMAAGAIWAGIPAVMKAVWKVDETLTTPMLNYVAILFAEYLLDADGLSLPWLFFPAGIR